MTDASGDHRKDHDDPLRGKPSQAEGEDPDRAQDARVQPAEGHPSPAEGGDEG